MHEQATTFIVCQLTAAILIRWSLYREYIRINSQNELQKANTTGTRHWPLKTSPEITPGARYNAAPDTHTHAKQKPTARNKKLYCFFNSSVRWFTWNPGFLIIIALLLLSRCFFNAKCEFIKQKNNDRWLSSLFCRRSRDIS